MCSMFVLPSTRCINPGSPCDGLGSAGKPRFPAFRMFPGSFSFLIKTHLQLVYPTSHFSCLASCLLAPFVTQRCPCAGDARSSPQEHQLLSIQEPCCAGGRAEPGPSQPPPSRLAVWTQWYAAMVSCHSLGLARGSLG